MLACKIHHLRHFCLGDFVGENAALPDAVMMNVQHDLGRGLDILLEEFLEHVNDELHRSVVVVQNQHAIEVGPLRLRLDLGDDGGRRTAGSASAVLIVGHARRICGNRRGVRIGAGNRSKHDRGVLKSSDESRIATGQGSDTQAVGQLRKRPSRPFAPCRLACFSTCGPSENMGPTSLRRKFGEFSRSCRLPTNRFPANNKPKISQFGPL